MTTSWPSALWGTTPTCVRGRLEGRLDAGAAAGEAGGWSWGGASQGQGRSRSGSLPQAPGPPPQQRQGRPSHQPRSPRPPRPPTHPTPLPQVDMLVGDIYGGRDYTGIGLSANTIASSFGKIVGQNKARARGWLGVGWIRQGQGRRLVRARCQGGACKQAGGVRAFPSSSPLTPTCLPPMLSRGWRSMGPPTWCSRCAA